MVVYAMDYDKQPEDMCENESYNNGYQQKQQTTSSIAKGPGWTGETWTQVSSLSPGSQQDTTQGNQVSMQAEILQHVAQANAQLRADFQGIADEAVKRYKLFPTQ